MAWAKERIEMAGAGDGVFGDDMQNGGEEAATRLTLTHKSKDRRRTC